MISKNTSNRIRSRFQRGDVFSEDSESPYVLSLAQRRSGSAQRTPITPDVRLYHRAVVVAQEATGAKKCRIAFFRLLRRTRKAKQALRRIARPKSSPFQISLRRNFIYTHQARSVAWSASSLSTSSRMRAGASVWARTASAKPSRRRCLSATATSPASQR
jgi:hypothetical protein